MVDVSNAIKEQDITDEEQDMIIDNIMIKLSEILPQFDEIILNPKTSTF
jgi:hypothetical protein